MSGTVNYPKVVDHLTDVIKELNVPCGEAAPAAPSEETRRADAVGLLKTLLSGLEQGPEGAAAAAAAEHGASAQQMLDLNWAWHWRKNWRDMILQAWQQPQQTSAPPNFAVATNITGGPPPTYG